MIEVAEPSPVMRTPRTVDVAITARCNLRCRYCYHFDNPEVSYRDLAAADWLRFFEELGRCRVMLVVLSGGEPFFREDLLELIDGIVANRMRFSILSNGGLIDDERAARIAATGRCDEVQISVDGSCAEVHDAMRGRGAFAGAMRGIECLQRHGLPVGVRVTVHPRNLDDLDAIAALLLEELGLPRFSTNSSCELGSCRRDGETVTLDVEERGRAMRRLQRLARRYEGRVTGSAGPLWEAEHWPRMVDPAAHGASWPGGGRLSGCGCAWTKIAVRADGVIVPCVMMQQVALGRINEDALEQIWQTSPGLLALRRREQIALADFEHCQGCAFIDRCRGGCPATVAARTGQIDLPNPDNCLRRFLEAGGVLPGRATEGER